VLSDLKTEGSTQTLLGTGVELAEGFTAFTLSVFCKVAWQKELNTVEGELA
jgi:hypothetical protein